MDNSIYQENVLLISNTKDRCFKRYIIGKHRCIGKNSDILKTCMFVIRND